MAKSKSASAVRWLDQPEEHDYPSAASFLSLLKVQAEVDRCVSLLRVAPVVCFKAKDIFRASGLSLLGVSNSHVERDRQKIQDGKPLSPILLVRDIPQSRVLIADGYHRLCAVYSIDEDADIPCKIV